MRFVLLFTIAFGIGRFLMPATGQINQEDVFKDVSHLFVGGLYGGAILATIVRLHWKRFFATLTMTTVSAEVYARVQGIVQYATYRSRQLWALALGLTLLEVVAFIIFKSS